MSLMPLPLSDRVPQASFKIAFLTVPERHVFKTICPAPNLLEETIDVEAKPLQEQIYYNTIKLKPK